MRESMAAYLLYRDNPSSVKLEEGRGREYVGMRLSELARECLEVKGVRTRGMNPDRIALSALTTTDFPAILANVAKQDPARRVSRGASNVHAVLPPGFGGGLQAGQPRSNVRPAGSAAAQRDG